MNLRSSRGQKRESHSRASKPRVRVVVRRTVYSRAGQVLVRAGTRGSVAAEDVSRIGKRWGEVRVKVRRYQYARSVPCGFVARAKTS